MADALVSALAQTILGNLNSVVLQEIGLACGLTDELNNLQSIFVTIQLVLQDAELKQSKSEAIRNWLRKLKSAAYDADNILDQIATEGLRRRVDSERGTQHELKSFLSSRNPLLFRSKMAHKVKYVREKLDAIAKERLQFHLSEDVVETRFGETVESRQTSSLVNELEIYGREEEKQMIIQELVDSRHEQDDLSVYAIWGMGGLGKTTLAQMVYNDERTKNNFQLRIWVCVSDDFSIQRLVREIIESIQGRGCNVSGLDPLQCLLQEKLRGRKFLLVLDDVWNENQRMWDGLKEVLRCGSKGSTLMVTTRIEKVASMMATVSPYKIGYLSDDDSWSLFKQRAFATGEEEENLVAIGKVIVKKCGAVPLAINALGSLMRYKSHESEWLAIQESEIWHLSDNENGILPALMLSYDNLLPQMRQCFVYCCIFPKDCEMEENQLIQLWMANGFIPSEGQTDLLLTGHLIFKELVWRSFFQDVKINYRGKRICKMHDLVHDLALSVMRHESYIMENDKVPKFPGMLRHLCFDMKYSWVVPKNEIKLPIDDSLRSFIVHRGLYPLFKNTFFSFLLKQQYMRVLDMNFYTIDQKLPSLVCKLKYLRYLVMSCDNLKRLPESLTCLLNLQTLKLTHSDELLELPNGLKVMKNLWFLELEKCDSLLCTPPGLGDLTCLRRLSIFIVGQDESQRIDQLKELNLGGKLSIRGLENVRNLEDAKNASLMRKKNMTSLKLSWKDGIIQNPAGYFEEVLEGLQPHQNLEMISIVSYRGSRFPNWMSTLALKNLKKISLENCGIDHLPSFGVLPSLLCLKLKGMDCIKHLGIEWCGDGERSFPALKDLIIERMPNLEEWIIADSVESFPYLQHLTIRWCPKLKELPFLPTLGHLDISNSSVTLVGSIHSLTSLESLSLSNFIDLDVLPVGLLQNHKSLFQLDITNLPIRTLSNVFDNLSALKHLDLYYCSNLESLPDGLQYLKTLEHLRIVSCDSIRSFPAATLESLSSLRLLMFNNCKKLNPLLGPLQRGTVLEYLLLDECPELKHLPESMQQLSALRNLRISDCEELCSLPNWLGSLQSLTRMEIHNCKKLKSMPDGFQGHDSLRELSIRDCPDLEKRCKKPKGRDWPKISHIPMIEINNETIQYLYQ
ncbi:hypothetical protein BUALT_Bualt11G0059900 [Buddleja alternifolia]|uniref:Disease resistance protein RGA3 n=1 Tax=Buddleja alternifolia TaxID=168488 RepID=A0AAV6X1C5_9LAMI|nr:hypothetical protein BUALT_Bualt11G0059900 [Buddleja alternifolia]